MIVLFIFPGSVGLLVLCDAWSINAQNDTWVSVIARMNGIFERIDIEVLHDRADMTGSNDTQLLQIESIWKVIPRSQKI